MKGKNILSFIPLHLTALERSESLEGWITSWVKPTLKNNEKIEFLDHDNWFYRGHDFAGGANNLDGVWIPK